MSNKDISSYDLWNSWRDFNQTGVDQSKGDSSVLTEDAREPESPALAEKDSAIVAETGQLAQATRQRLRGLNYKDRGAPGSDANPVDIPDTESELVQLYNHLISMGVSRKEAEEMVNNVLEMLPSHVSESVNIIRLFEACGCGSKPESDDLGNFSDLSKTNIDHDEAFSAGCSVCGAPTGKCGHEHSADSIPGMGRDFNYDESHSDEGVQARDQLLVVNYLSGMLMNALHDEDELPAWVQAYITEAELLIQKTFKYLVPHMKRVETDEARTATQGGDDGNVVVVTQSESTAPAPMRSRADHRVRSAVKAARKTGKMSTVSLSDIFDD